MGLKYSDINKIQKLYNLSVYEKSCKKYNKNNKIPLYSWEMKYVFDDYIKNDGGINGLCLNMPSQLRKYMICYEGRLYRDRFLSYNIQVFFDRFPVKLPSGIIKIIKSFVSFIERIRTLL